MIDYEAVNLIHTLRITVSGAICAALVHREDLGIEGRKTTNLTLASEFLVRKLVTWEALDHTFDYGDE